MVRLRGSTWALGFESICLGSVTATGAARVWAATVSVTTVLMSMTIANETKVRMGVAGFGVRVTGKILAEGSKAVEQRPRSRFRVLVHVHRAPGFVGGVAQVLERTVDTLRLASDAKLASVPDDLVGKENPLLARDDSHQVLFDLLGIIV